VRIATMISSMDAGLKAILKKFVAGLENHMDWRRSDIVTQMRRLALDADGAVEKSEKCLIRFEGSKLKWNGCSTTGPFGTFRRFPTVAD
jgi:hypothetical protein